MPKKPKRTLFEKPKYKYLAKIVRLDTPENAKKSTEKLEKEFINAKTDKKRLRIARASQKASKIADASRKRKNLSRKEQSEYRKIAILYKNTSNMLFKEYESLKKRNNKHRLYKPCLYKI